MTYKIRSTIFLFFSILISTFGFAATQIVLVGSGGNNFSPNSFSVNVGDTVKWMYSSGSHTTTSTSVPSGAATWNEVMSSVNDSLVYVTTTAGTYNYNCTPHSASMTGTFTVNAPPPPPPTNTVTVMVGASGNTFSPNTFTIAVGDTVRFIWASGTHTTTSTSIPSGAASWDKPMASTNDSLIYIVTEAGTYNYQCTPHSASMTGSFTATAPPISNTVTVLVGSGGNNFSPNNFSIAVGDTVRFIWSSGTHTTTSTSVPSGAATWDKAMASANDSLIYVVTTAGIYDYKCTPHGASMTGTFTATGTTGIKYAQEHNFSMFPNPANNRILFNMQLDSNSNLEINVFDLSGKRVAQLYSGTQHAGIVQREFEVGHMLSSGMYLVQVKWNKGSFTEKLVIQ